MKSPAQCLAEARALSEGAELETNPRIKALRLNLAEAWLDIAQVDELVGSDLVAALDLLCGVIDKLPRRMR